MVYRDNEVLAKYGSVYGMRRAIVPGSLFKMGRGVYSDELYPDPNAVACALWLQVLLTMDSAFYLHDLTDIVPGFVHVATPRNSTRIRDSQVRQHFMLPELMDVGIQTMDIDGSPVRVFIRERMLVELLRCAETLPFDYTRSSLAPTAGSQTIWTCKRWRTAWAYMSAPMACSEGCSGRCCRRAFGKDRLRFP